MASTSSSVEDKPAFFDVSKKHHGMQLIEFSKARLTLASAGVKVRFRAL